MNKIDVDMFSMDHRQWTKAKVQNLAGGGVILMWNKEKELQGEEIIHLLFTLGKKMRELARRQAARYGINANELETILFLAHGPPDTSKDLACRKGYSRSLVSKTVDSLLRNGYITTEQDGQDRRVMHLKLLPKAQSIVNEMEAMRKKMEDFSLKGVTKEELHTVVQVFSKIQKNIDSLITEEPRENE